MVTTTPGPADGPPRIRRASLCGVGDEAAIGALLEQREQPRPRDDAHAVAAPDVVGREHPRALRAAARVATGTAAAC
jgi:hypothetical protein